MHAIEELRRGDVPNRDRIIWRSLTKAIGEYKVNAPHGVAKKYLWVGRELAPGDKIGYIITKKGAKLCEKVQPYFEVAPDQVDTEYYV